MHNFSPESNLRSLIQLLRTFRQKSSWEFQLEMLRRERSFSFRDALSATPSKPEASTRLDPTSAESWAVRLARLPDSRTPTPTSRRESHGSSNVNLLRKKISHESFSFSGTKILFSNILRTQRNTSPEPRWCSLV